MAFLLGYKTYITVGCAAAAYAAFLVGLITQEQLGTILVGLGIPAVGFLRSAISNQTAAVAEKVEEVKREVVAVKQGVQETKHEVQLATEPEPLPPPVRRTR
jgi:hypothetical protein